MRLFAGVLLCAVGVAGSAWADGKRDLEDGIAFYENLDTDRAMERLTRATTAPDLRPADQAKAFLYLGMLQFEIGSVSDAKKSWAEALRLERDIKVPDGTSPKTIEAIEEVRAKLAPIPGGPKTEPPPPVYEPPGGRDEPPPPPPAVDVAPPPPPPVVDATASPADDGSSNTWLWVGIGAGAAAVVAVAVIVGVVVAGGGNGSECEMGGGGCLGVSFR